MRIFFYLLIFIIPIVFFVACKKNNTEVLPEFHQAFAASETVLEDVLNISQSILSKGQLPFAKGNCDVQIDTLENENIFINFGLPCKMSDNRFRSGSINIQAVENGETIIDLTEYAIFTNQEYFLTGTYKLKVNQSFKPYVTINGTANYHVFDRTSGEEIYVAEVMHEREIVEGGSTADTKDDVISKSGSGTFNLLNGKQWKMNYASSATKRITIGCIDFLTGQAVFANSTNANFLFDWGGGTCDNRYTITQNEQTKLHQIP